MLTDKIIEEISSLSAKGLRRGMRLVEGPQGPRVTMGGRETILMCSNDYLGLANHPLVKEAAIKALERWGAGAGASRLVSGNMEPHAMLEDRLRAFKGADAVLLFNSGYNANMGVITALAGRDAEIFSDRLNHASIVDACLLSRAKVRRYPNRDLDALERLLKGSTAKERLIVTDSVFSMDGAIAPMGELAALAERHGAALYIDDAHATGVLGHSGKGSLEHFAIRSRPDIIQMGTLGKALGSFGAFVAGSRELIELLVSRSRPFIYTTALPPSVCAAAARAIDIIEEDPGLIKKLWDNTSMLKKGLSELKIDTMGSSTPIVPISVGTAQRALEVSARLLDEGVFIQAIRPPTVPEGTSRLRATVTAAHSEGDLCKALKAIEGAFRVK